MKLSHTEEWIAEHSIGIFAVVAILMVLGTYFGLRLLGAQERVQRDVNVLKPQVTRVSRAICDEQSLNHKGRAARCAARIRVGLVNCRRVERCRAALLAALTYPPPTATLGGGGAQNPSPAGQQPEPGHTPGGQGKRDHGKHHRPPHGSPAPAPEPAQPPAAAAPAPEAQPSSPPAPGNSGETPAAEKSQGVHACVETTVSACLDAGLPELP